MVSALNGDGETHCGRYSIATRSVFTVCGLRRIISDPL
jgi:hypothetical protein